MRSSAGIDEREQLLAEHGPHRGRVPGALDPHPSAQPLDQLGRRSDPEVGLEQERLDVLPVLLGQVVAGEQGQQARAHGALAAGEPGAQPDEPAGGRGGDLESRAWSGPGAWGVG